MKISSLVYGFAFLAVPASAATLQGLPNQDIVLGTESTYSVQQMKDKCVRFEKDAHLKQQLKPFSIRIECEKTENVWEELEEAKPLPRFETYAASGVGKGRIEGEDLYSQLESEYHACLVHEESTFLYKGYLSLSCDELLMNGDSLVDMCINGVQKAKGQVQQVDWQQVGDAEVTQRISNGCDIETKLVGEEKEADPTQQQDVEQRHAQW